MIPALLLALACPGALAHVPHDVLLSLIPPTDLDPDGPWYAIGDQGDRSLLHRGSGFGPAGWTVIGGAPTGDLLVDGCQLFDGTLVLASADRLWWSEDEAESWSWQALDAGIGSVACEPELLVATEEGVYAGLPGEDLALVLPDQVGGERFVGPGGVLAIAQDGDALALLAAGTWRPLLGPGVRLRAGVIAEDGTVYAGDDDGEVWRHDGEDWQRCGPLPAWDGQGLSYPDVLAMAAQDEQVLAVAAWRGPFVSEDGCASWQDRHAEMDPWFTGSGHCASPTTAFTDLVVAGDRWALSGWDGLALSEDGGETWVEPFLIAPDYARGLAFSPAFAEDAGVFLGGYTAGVTRSDDGGMSFDSAATNLSAPNVQRLVFPPTNSGDSPLYAISGHVLWRGDDGGADWTLLAPPQALVASISTLAEPPRLWSVGTPAGEGGAVVAESMDQGRSWRPLDSLIEALAGSALVGAAQVRAEDGSLVTCCTVLGPAGVLCSEDDGASWERRWQGGDEQLTRPLAWPVDQPTRLLVAADHGIVFSDDLGATWDAVAATERERVLVLEAASDGTLLAATTGGLLLRSDDGGEGWIELALRLPASPYALAPHPDFASTALVLVGTHDGPFVVLDLFADVPEWGPWGTHCLVDDLSNFVERSALGEPEDYPGQRLVSVGRVVAGGSMRTGLRGHTLRVLGAVEHASVVELVVDGETMGVLGGSPQPALGVLAELTGLEDGWHELVLRGVSGDGVLVDAFEGQGDGLVFEVPPVAVEDDPPGGRCDGCAGAPRRPAGLVLLAAGLALALGRRRRAFSP